MSLVRFMSLLGILSICRIIIGHSFANCPVSTELKCSFLQLPRTVSLVSFKSFPRIFLRPLQLLLTVFQGISSFRPLSNPIASVLSFCYSSTLLSDTKFCSHYLLLPNKPLWNLLPQSWECALECAFYTLYFDGMHGKLYLLAYTCPNDFYFYDYFYSEYNRPLHDSLPLAVLGTGNRCICWR